jgi:hypothetical protein
MRHAMWMGTRGYEMWVPVPAVGPAYDKVGWTSQAQHLNGGVTLRQSKSAHGTWQLTWGKGCSWDDIMPIRDMAEGVYDSANGVNLIYWLDPTAMARNVLPQGWATPHVAAEDGMPLLLDTPPDTRVELPSPYRLPARSALYPQSTAQPQRLYIPIPPGHVFHFGWAGDADSAGQIIVADVDETGATTANVSTPGPADFGTTGLWTNLDLPRAPGRIGVELRLAGTAPASIRAMLATVQPAGTPIPLGQLWRGGMGHSGCQFENKVGLSPQSVPLDQTGASTVLVETGAYL